MFRSGVFLALAATATAKKCSNIMVPVSLTAENAVFDIETPTTKVDVTNFLLELTRNGENYASTIQSGVSGLLR